MKQLSLAMIGGGIDSAAGYAHFSASQIDSHFQITSGFFSRNTVRNKNSAQIYGVDSNRLYSDFDELLFKESNNIDCVLILSPTDTHYNYLLKTMKAGIPTICEKPLCTTSKESHSILKMQSEKNTPLAIIYNYTGYPMIRELKNMVESGDLGQISHFSVEMPQEGYSRVDITGSKNLVQEWRLNDHPIPMIHLDLGVHVFQLLCFLISDKPSEVVSVHSCNGLQGVIDNAYAILKYKNNISGQLWFGKSSIGHRNGLKISLYGTKGSATWIQVDPEKLELAFNDGRVQTLDRSSINLTVANQRRYNRFKPGHPAGFIEALANLYTDIHSYFIDPCNNLNQYIYSASHSAEALTFLEAMSQSSSTHSWETIIYK